MSGEPVGILRSLEDALQRNGDMSTAEHRRLLLLAFQGLINLGEATNKKLDKLADNTDKRLQYLETFIPLNKAVLWVAGAFGVSVIALIWALITGQATLVFS
jgi:hypothetical protein